MENTEMEKEILAHLMALESLAIDKCCVKARQYNEIIEMNRKQIESRFKQIESKLKVLRRNKNVQNNRA